MRATARAHYVSRLSSRQDEGEESGGILDRVHQADWLLRRCAWHFVGPLCFARCPSHPSGLNSGGRNTGGAPDEDALQVRLDALQQGWYQSVRIEECPVHQHCIIGCVVQSHGFHRVWGRYWAWPPFCVLPHGQSDDHYMNRHRQQHCSVSAHPCSDAFSLIFFSRVPSSNKMLVYAPGTYIHVKYISQSGKWCPSKTSYLHETQFFFLFGPSGFGTRARWTWPPPMLLSRDQDNIGVCGKTLLYLGRESWNCDLKQWDYNPPPKC